MTKDLKPDWSKEQKAEGKRIKKAWEVFFSEGEAESETSKSTFLAPPKKMSITKIRAAHEVTLLRYPNVVGVSEGIRTKRGKPTGEPCIVVYVDRKIPKVRLEKSKVLPRQIEGILIDVVEVGKVEPLPV